ncbi:MAG: hypothetical protein AAFZ09_05135 [Pseudomonadota bacterium]
MAFAVEMFKRMVEGIIAPARSARGVLAERWGLDTAIQVAILAYCLNAILAILMPDARATALPGSWVVAHLVNIIEQVLRVGLLGGLIWGIGALLGGKGTLYPAFALSAWHTLVTVLLQPLFMLGTGAMRRAHEAAKAAAAAAGEGAAEVPAPMDLGAASTGILVLFAFGVAAWFWLMAVYAMELHGFRNVWSVLGVMVAAAMLFSAFALNLA